MEVRVFQNGSSEAAWTDPLPSVSAIIQVKGASVLASLLPQGGVPRITIQPRVLRAVDAPLLHLDNCIPKDVTLGVSPSSTTTS